MAEQVNESMNTRMTASGQGGVIHSQGVGGADGQVDVAVAPSLHLTSDPGPELPLGPQLWCLAELGSDPSYEPVCSRVPGPSHLAVLERRCPASMHV